VIAIPSTAGTVQVQEEQRLAKQLESLQAEPGKLAQLASALDDAMAKNSVPIPDELISSFQIPDLNKISFLPVYICRSDTSGPLEETAEPDKKRARVLTNNDNVLESCVLLESVCRSLIQLSLWNNSIYFILAALNLSLYFQTSQSP